MRHGEAGYGIDIARHVLTTRTAAQYVRANGSHGMLDLFTASAIVKVHDGISAEMRAKFNSVDIEVMARLAFETIKRSAAKAAARARG